METNKINHYRDSKILIIINTFSEYVILLAAYVLSGFLRSLLPKTIAKIFWWHNVFTFVFVFIIVSIVAIVIYTIAGDYKTIYIRNKISEISWVFVVQLICALLGAALLFLTDGSQFSRWWIILYIFVSVFLLFLKRVLCQFIAKRFSVKYTEAYQVLLIGSGIHAQKVCEILSSIGEDHYHLVGYLADNECKEIPNYIGEIDRLKDVILNNNVRQVVVAEDIDDVKTIKTIVSECGILGVDTYIIPSFCDYLYLSSSISNRDAFEREFISELPIFHISAINTDNILGVDIAVTNMEKTVSDISDNLEKWRGEYICISNVHTTVMAHDDEKYREIQNNAVLALPDGGPLSSYSRTNGNQNAERVTGPDLMKELLNKSGEHGWKHFFYGSTEETLKKLNDIFPERYPNAQIVGMIAPPFRALTPEEDEEFVSQINESSPDFVWVGLGAPKQEIWMASHRTKVKALMIGVGAAFDYEAGNISRAPKWMQKLSLEWLYRLIQDPKRLFKRYFVTNAKYLWLTRR